ncbi:putative S-adenosyl-L-methionine-dependent methyltransferase [Mycolicibacterium chitae]|uniref:S-adenosyl-L-methionine-dependent methyltransferase n=1 Tax=Mycolicibacterium chitae TaxID=1792 RepID=A0A3S4TP72_MYCCI|nr:class I SAM-dependent methyltransferase [Mycolicibacterium chitae]MCV7108412.1 class I SAM-dependent methyltransferase [Mycolicibacterium chitae]BBZ00643.1 putative S-adenosyl-L-methionine-dependent methyltransferase [Mycolicibacterium chitae]VEG49491.1 methyltransferase, putative, TIGR00027 family [Mycolicibacterium chitae]
MARSEGDTWDLASSVGATATSVAASRALASRGPNPPIHDPYAAALVRAVGTDYFVRVAEGAVDFDEDPLFDGDTMRAQIVVRTRYFDDFFAEATAAGIRQAVILASGLDTRAYRMDWPADTVVFEIDQPAVIEFKTRVLGDLGAEPAADRRAVAVDLREDWPAVLTAAGFDPDAPTAWIAEGLLIYLPPDAQDRLLDHITALSAPGSRLATEHMDSRAFTGDWARKLTERGQRHGSSVDLTKLFYSGERNSARDYLAERGWQISIRTTAQAYTAQGYEAPKDELLAMIGDSGYLSAELSARPT